MVYDVTDPIGGPHVPLTRPHAVLEPFQPPDRILFGSPVASVAFVQNDWPLTQTYSQTATVNSLATALTGLLCNPNPNVDTSTPTSVADGLAAEQGPFSDNGAYYRNAILVSGGRARPEPPPRSLRVRDADERERDCHRRGRLGRPLSPSQSSSSAGREHMRSRRRVRDLQGPVHHVCMQANWGRRQNESPTGSSMVPSARLPPEPFPSSSSDTNPYHTPVAFQTAYTDTPTSLEWFFPVSAPHRARSGFTLNNTAVNGNHAAVLLLSACPSSSRSARR